MLNPRFRNNSTVIAICAFWSTVSFLYLFRPFLGESADAFQAFERSTCLEEASLTVGTTELKTNQGTIRVRNFLPELELLNSNTELESYVVYEEDFQMSFDDKKDQFSILLNLNSQTQTPGNAARTVARYLQNSLCLEKQQICALDYKLAAPRATNAQYPSLRGKALSFNYCSFD